MTISRRVSQLPAYHFARLEERVRSVRDRGVAVIDLAKGNPDLPAPAEVVETLREAAGDPSNHRYPDFTRMPEFREAFVRWFSHRFGVELDSDREIVPLIGSKEGLAHLPIAIMDPGNVALLPDPGYPVYATATRLAGGTPYAVPLRFERGWLPDLDAIPPEAARAGGSLWLNYPNNPTGASASLLFFEEAVRFAHAKDILLVHDLAYAEVRFDGYAPPSILQIPGAREVSVEFHSLSKTYNMGGFRIGAVVGNASVVDAMARLKSNLDSGIFRPIQLAAARALTLPDSWIAKRNEVYRRRRDLMVDSLRALGIEVQRPLAGLYLWPRAPSDRTSSEFGLELLERAGVLVAPGTNFGQGGKGYVRISLTAPEATLAAAAERIGDLLAGRSVVADA